MKQLSVYIENEIGSMAKVTAMLKEADISLKAISIFDSPDFCIMRCIVDDEKKAKEILQENKLAVRVSDVIAVCLEDKTGSLDQLLQICSGNGINIRYMYSFVYRGIMEPLLVLRTDHTEEAVTVFNNENVKMIDSL